MPAYKYKTEQQHQDHLKKRRAHYARNKERIQKQNKESLRRRQAANPDAYRPQSKSATAPKPQPTFTPEEAAKRVRCLDEHPDKDQIWDRIVQGL